MSEIKSLPENLAGVHIHFVGIKGTGMAALVEILFHNGAIITGSDVSERFYTDEVLENLGLKALPFDSANITDQVQYVVYSSAYKLDKNPDLIEAVRRNIPCLLYTEALGSYSAHAFSCGVCGVHGKTSTTGLVGTILKEFTDIPAQVLVGSVINSFGNTCTYTSPAIKIVSSPSAPRNDVGRNCEQNSRHCERSEAIHKNIFVAETCEYQRHFMSFCPQKIILTSVEPDHQDYYPTYEDIRDAFVDYICKLPEHGDLIYCADDSGAVETAMIAYNKRPDINMIPYGVNAGGDFKLTFGKVENEKNNFSLKIFDEANDAIYLRMPGKHEVLDATAAVALVCQILRYYGKHPCEYVKNIRQGLANFSGGKRRSEIVGRFTTESGNDVIVLDDYGHHPTAVKTTLDGYREFYKGRKLIVDFMSHTYSRTQALLKEFAASFGSADVVILHKIYSSARENAADFNITGRTLYDEVKKIASANCEQTARHCEQTARHCEQDTRHCERSEAIHYFEEILDATDFVKGELNKKLPPEYPDGYLFITMGAGDNWKLGKEILKND